MEVSYGGMVKPIVSSMVLIGIIWFVLHLYNIIWLNSERLGRKLRKQGIKGPSPSFLYGNLLEMHKIQLSSTTTKFHKDSDADQFIGHDYTFSLFPYFEHWRQKYGRVYTYSTGIKQHVYVNDPELVKEMNQTMTLDLGKPSYVSKKLAPMLGNGILRSNGLLWARHRKIVAPEFFMDKVKGMVDLMVESVQPMLRKWEENVESSSGLVADVRVDEDLRDVSAEVISRACFGSSYFKGKLIFSKLRTLQKAISNQGFLFSLPRSGFLAVKKQREIRSLEKEIETNIWEVVKERQHSVHEKDLMQSILDGAVENNDNSNNVDIYESSKSFIVDNCKNIYFAGHEATAIAASWCLMLLAQHPEWQARIRTEVAQVLHNGLPDANSVSQMKMVSMVIQETLRLYPPAAFVSREVLEETRLGHITIPKGVCLWTLIPTLHRDPDIWGPDSNEFKPERFANGISKACKFPQAYIPFGLGPRLCLGRNFAMVELKIVLSLIISKFEFSLSPLYRHSPAYRMIVEPEHGVYIRVKIHPAVSE